jgi:hypothetical protein
MSHHINHFHENLACNRVLYIAVDGRTNGMTSSVEFFGITQWVARSKSINEEISHCSGMADEPGIADRVKNIRIGKCHGVRFRKHWVHCRAERSNYLSTGNANFGKLFEN